MHKTVGISTINAADNSMLVHVFEWQLYFIDPRAWYNIGIRSFMSQLLTTVSVM